MRKRERLKLNKEVIMITPIALGAVKRYVAKGDKENPTVWLLGAIGSIAKTKIMGDSLDIIMKDGVPEVTPSLNAMAQDLLVVKVGLKGYENFPIKYETEKLMVGGAELTVVSDKIIEQIPRNVLTELATVIWGENSVSEEERKN